MKQYNVTGMSCAACSARVEKAVSAVPGVTACSVSLLTNSMGVEGDASESEIIKAVTDAGYGASLKNKAAGKAALNYDDQLKDTETPKMKKRLIASVILMIPLMYVSMGHMMWGWPVPGFMNGNHIAMGLYELILSAIIMVINQKFFVNGFKGVIHKAPNMDTLVAMGSAASFIYSTYSLFAMTVAEKAGNTDSVAELMNEFYFESAAMILTLITVGKMLEARSKGKTTDAIKSLMRLAPKTAVVLTDGKEKEVPVEQVKPGDRFAVRPGDSIPVDGLIIDGISAVNESALTGESIPVDKAAGDHVSAATINQSGYLVCEATKVGEDTTLAKIIQMVSDASATKAPIAKIADKVSGIFVPAVIGIAVITFIIWIIAGQTLGYALARAISVLVISCPCALGLATPVAIMVANGKGARNGIMFKTAASLEAAGKIQIAALDKTGTITKGQPKVVRIIPAEGFSENELLSYAYALEKKSEHPLAKAVVDYVESSDRMHVSTPEINEFRAETGSGLRAETDNKLLTGGNEKYISGQAEISGSMKEEALECAQKGMTPLFFALEGQLLGMIAVADVIKEDSAKAVAELKNMGIHVVMLTGDNARTAESIGKEAGVDEVIAGVLPDEKEAVVRALQEKGKVLMIGDGINDAPALTRADTGIAIGAGTDIAIDAADVVLMKSSLADAVAAIRISRAALRNIHENLFWAFIYNIIGIPLAAGLWIPIFGWTLNPMFGAAAMSLSSFCVVTNALRLNLIKVYDSARDRVIKNPVGSEPLLTEYIIAKEAEKKMEITVKGMMCPHCEAHVKKAIEKIAGVKEATADHTKDLVVIETEGEISLDAVKAAVEDAGYEFAGER